VSRELLQQKQPQRPAANTPNKKQDNKKAAAPVAAPKGAGRHLLQQKQPNKPQQGANNRKPNNRQGTQATKRP
jgi:hypothetical protein